MEERAVTCPVIFTAHISRKHRDIADRSISDLCRHSASPSSSVHFESDHFGPQVNETITKKATDEGGMDISEDFSHLFLRNVSLFYLTLQGQFLLPASTIQNIVEMQNIHELGKTYSLSKLT